MNQVLPVVFLLQSCLLCFYLNVPRLTAFVLRSFVKAQSFIYIEPNLIKESKTWLESNQKKTGCFQKVGKLFNDRMKVSSKFALWLTLNVTEDEESDIYLLLHQHSFHLCFSSKECQSGGCLNQSATYDCF